jgi:hypothetical protein
LGFCEQLADQHHRYRRQAARRAFTKRGVKADHQQLLEAAVAGRADDAVALLRAHFERTAPRLCKDSQTACIDTRARPMTCLSFSPIQGRSNRMCSSPQQEVADALALAHSAEVRARVARRAAAFRRERQRHLDQAPMRDAAGPGAASLGAPSGTGGWRRD